MHLKYAEMSAIVVHQIMKHGDNTPNNLTLSLVNWNIMIVQFLLYWFLTLKTLS